jgi:hypothetical protein
METINLPFLKDSHWNTKAVFAGRLQVVPKLTSVPRLEIYEVKILSFNGNNQYETQ